MHLFPVPTVVDSIYYSAAVVQLLSHLLLLPIQALVVIIRYCYRCYAVVIIIYYCCRFMQFCCHRILFAAVRQLMSSCTIVTDSFSYCRLMLSLPLLCSCCHRILFLPIHAVIVFIHFWYRCYAVVVIVYYCCRFMQLISSYNICRS